MKSLEILDKNTDWYGDVTLKASEVEAIKQSLEVLEIIKNKTVNIEPLKSCLEEYENDNKTLEVYNHFQEDYRKLTLEELLKLKQWLEVNE